MGAEGERLGRRGLGCHGQRLCHGGVAFGSLQMLARYRGQAVSQAVTAENLLDESPQGGLFWMGLTRSDLSP